MTGPGGTFERFTVPADFDGQRADRVVAGVLAMSRAEARQAVDAGRVRIDGDPIGAATKLAAGVVVEVEVPAVRSGLKPLDMPLVVRYESSTMLVVDKPPGLVVHPGAGHRDDTLANVLVHHHPELAGLGEEHRWGLVHRLDRDTSGLLIVARTAPAHAELQSQMKRREIKREYLALVLGRIDPATGTIEAPLGRDPGQPTRMALRQNGRFARTHYMRLAAWTDMALLSIKLDTGRTHQIRVHLSSIGAPLVGDRTYGASRARRGDAGRVWLHAHRLSFVDPAQPGVEVVVESPLPPDLAATLDKLGPPVEGALPTADPAAPPSL